MSGMGYDGTLTVGSEALHVKDVNISLAADEVDQTTRNHQGWKSRRAGLRSWGVTFDMEVQTSDSVFTALSSAYENATSLAATAVDGLGHSISGDVYVTQFDRTEALGDTVKVSVGLVGDGKPTIA